MVAFGAGYCSSPLIFVKKKIGPLLRTISITSFSCSAACLHAFRQCFASGPWLKRIKLVKPSSLIFLHSTNHLSQKACPSGATAQISPDCRIFCPLRPITVARPPLMADRQKMSVFAPLKPLDTHSDSSLQILRSKEEPLRFPLPPLRAMRFLNTCVVGRRSAILSQSNHTVGGVSGPGPRAG